MNTPICDFVKAYGDSDAVRLHMPGHKGVSHLGCETLDITEIAGADVLYHADGIIRQSEDNATALFGSARTVYSTEGSSLGIRGMLYLAMTHTGRRTFIVNALSLGITPNIVMKWTGHSDYKAMKPYIDIVDSIKASSMTKFDGLI